MPFMYGSTNNVTLFLVITSVNGKQSLKFQRHKVNAVCWVKANPDLVISGDETGNLVIWDVKTNSTRSVSFGKSNSIFVLEAHPYDEDIVAFGCRLGLVFVVNHTGKITVIVT